MRNLVDLFVRFSHVFFISSCCNDAPNENIIPPSLLQEEPRETPEQSRYAESASESVQEGISSSEEVQTSEIPEEKEILDEEFYDVELN